MIVCKKATGITDVLGMFKNHVGMFLPGILNLSYIPKLDEFHFGNKHLLFAKPLHQKESIYHIQYMSPF